MGSSVTLTKFPPTKAIAIRAALDSGMSQAKAAEMFGTSRQTVNAIAHSEMYGPEGIDRIKKRISGKLYRVADNCVDGINAEKIQRASAPQLMITAATAIDKARLIDGQVTARVEFQSATDIELEAEMQALNDELARYKAGEIVNSQIDADNQSESTELPAFEQELSTPAEEHTLPSEHGA